MDTFQAIIGWKRMRNRENKNYRSAPFLPNAKKKIPKNSKNIKIVKRFHYGFISSQKQVGKGGEKEKIKIIVTFRFYPTRNSKFQKKREKIQIIKKYPYGFLSRQNRFEKAKKGRK